MKELTVNEIKSVAGGFRFGCDYVNPITGVAFDSAAGKGVGRLAYYSGASRNAIIGAARTASAVSFAGWSGYNIGTFINRATGRCDFN